MGRGGGRKLNCSGLVQREGLKDEGAQLIANVTCVLEENDVSNVVPRMQKKNLKLICFSREQ